MHPECELCKECESYLEAVCPVLGHGLYIYPDIQNCEELKEIYTETELEDYSRYSTDCPGCQAAIDNHVF